MPHYAVLDGDVVEVLQDFDDNTFDGCLCDPPYGLTADKKGGTGAASLNLKHPAGRSRITTGFMGRAWDGRVPGTDVWTAVLRVLKPGAFLLAFGGTRTHHRLACAIEDAGFELRDTLMWLYGSGFPKSHDISKAIDKVAGRIGKNVLAIKREIRARYDSTGMTLKQFNAACGFEASGYLRESSTWAAVLPSRDKWERIKSVLDCGDELDELFDEAEREILGSAQWTNSAMHFRIGEDHTQRVLLDVTTPATSTAQLWHGYGTALKPAWESIILAQRPRDGTFANNVLMWGCGGLAIDGCRIGYQSDSDKSQATPQGRCTGSVFDSMTGQRRDEFERPEQKGRWPANLLLSHLPECQEVCAENCPVVLLDAQAGTIKTNYIEKPCPSPEIRGHKWGTMQQDRPARGYDDSGGRSRFFYQAKASRSERNHGLDGFYWRRDKSSLIGFTRIIKPEWDELNKRERAQGNIHPTVKPLGIIEYIAKLIMPPESRTLLVPFSGSGSEMIGALKVGWKAVVGIDIVEDYNDIAKARLKHWID